ncbi:MAG: hypothetical protein KUG81_10140 [Gammaproteobacteria bacterium]|nr:hypothetical protein [Gammaproteobacteria bacterium]
MAKRKSKFTSFSTPGHKQDCSNHLVELAFLRQNKGKRLPEFFWREQRYKWRYRKEVQACRKFIKKYGEGPVLLAAIENLTITTWTDFGHVEYLLQKHAERRRLRALPKDNTPVVPESVKVTEDYRDFEPAKPKLGLFDRLKELSNGEEN